MITRREFLLSPLSSWFTPHDAEIARLNADVANLKRDVGDLKRSLSQLWATQELSARNINANSVTFVGQITALNERVSAIERNMERKLI